MPNFSAIFQLGIVTSTLFNLSLDVQYLDEVNMKLIMCPGRTITICLLSFLFRRNDPISAVRESAEIAIKHIGGTEASKALKINSVLSGEMKALRTSNK